MSSGGQTTNTSNNKLKIGSLKTKFKSSYSKLKTLGSTTTGIKWRLKETRVLASRDKERLRLPDAQALLAPRLSALIGLLVNLLLALGRTPILMIGKKRKNSLLSNWIFASKSINSLVLWSFCNELLTGKRISPSWRLNLRRSKEACRRWARLFKPESRVRLKERNSRDNHKMGLMKGTHRTRMSLLEIGVKMLELMALELSLLLQSRLQPLIDNRLPHSELIRPKSDQRQARLAQFPQNPHFQPLAD